MTIDLEARLRADLGRLADHLLADPVSSAGPKAPAADLASDGSHVEVIDGSVQSSATLVPHDSVPNRDRWQRRALVAAAVVILAIGSAMFVAVRSDQGADLNVVSDSTLPPSTSAPALPEVVVAPGAEDTVVLQRGRSIAHPDWKLEVRLDLPRPGDASTAIDPVQVWSAEGEPDLRSASEYRLILLRLTDTLTGPVHADGTVGDSTDRLVWAIVRVEDNAPLSTIPTAESGQADSVPFDIQFYDAVDGSFISGRSVSAPESVRTGP